MHLSSITILVFIEYICSDTKRLGLIPFSQVHGAFFRDTFSVPGAMHLFNCQVPYTDFRHAPIFAPVPCTWIDHLKSTKQDTKILFVVLVDGIWRALPISVVRFCLNATHMVLGAFSRRIDHTTGGPMGR